MGCLSVPWERASGGQGLCALVKPPGLGRGGGRGKASQGSRPAQGFAHWALESRCVGTTTDQKSHLDGARPIPEPGRGRGNACRPAQEGLHGLGLAHGIGQLYYSVHHHAPGTVLRTGNELGMANHRFWPTDAAISRVAGAVYPRQVLGQLTAFAQSMHTADVFLWPGTVVCILRMWANGPTHPFWCVPASS